jgi:hypothetical protein
LSLYAKTMIERLVTLLTPPTPYLGVERPMASGAMAPAPFSAALKASAQPLPVTPLVSQNLQMSIQSRALTAAPLTPPAPLTPQMVQGLHTLSRPMANTLAQHPVVCLPLTGLTPQQLLEQQWLRQLMFHKDDSDPVITQGLLTFLPIERPFVRESPRLRRRHIQGHGFLTFRFAWESDDLPPDVRSSAY